MSELQPLRILTTNSIDILRARSTGSGASEIWESDLDELVENLGLVFLESEYLVDLTYELQLSTEGLTARELDATNASQILRILPRLTPADAVDERIWVTLALGHFKNYLRDRWPVDETDLGNHVSNHVFASTSRRRERDHAIARLWWSGHYVRQLAGEDHDQALEAFFSNSDLPVQLLGRPNLATITSIARPMLMIFGKYFLEKKVKYDRNGVRSFLEGIDFRAGRRALGAMQDDEVHSIVEASFREHLKLG